MADKNYDLSRRKALLGLGTIGAAGAGAGLGTSALFSDTESFENNTITAGTLDMEVTGEIVAANQEYIDDVADITGNPLESEEVEVGFNVQDFKPGDWFAVCITVDSVAENPFYLTMFAEDLTESGGTKTEPEPTPDDGELGANLFTTVWGAWGGDPASGRSEFSELGPTADRSVSGGGGSQGGWSEPDYPSGDATLQNGDSVEYTTIRELVNGYGANFNGWGSPDGILAGGTGSPVEVGASPGSSDLLSDPDNDDEGELVFYILFELPTDVGNEVQGDELSIDLRFSAEQVRNNSDPRSGN
jgi:predicted ribosomally synthesized peptide with SipW-like signal peptide